MPDDNYYDSYELRSVKFSHFMIEGIFEAARNNMKLFAYFNSPGVIRHIQENVVRYAHGPTIERLIQTPFDAGSIKTDIDSPRNAPTLLFKYEGNDSSLRDDEDPSADAIIEILVDAKTGKIIEIGTEKIK